MTSMLKVAAISSVLALASFTHAHAQTVDSSGTRFVPRGHSYDANNKRLPTLNSYSDEVNNRTDQLETEIYRARRNQAYWNSWVNSTHGTYLNGEPRLAPDF